MKIIYNRLIPFPGFLAINIFGVLFVRSEYRGRVTPSVLVHESIHTAQMKELGYVGFYILYLLEWLYRLVFHTKTAYRGISFEREAYANQDKWTWNYQGSGGEWESAYLRNRKPFAQWRKP